MNKTIEDATCASNKRQAKSIPLETLSIRF